MSNTEAKVSRIPDCDFCKQSGVKVKAYADAKTSMGPWANVCKNHFDRQKCQLGLGLGQVFVKV